MKYLREMKETDINAVVALIEAHDEDDAEQAEKEYREMGGHFDQYVLESEGNIIGITGYITPPSCERTHWLSWTYIHPDHTNQGHGRTMLTELIDHIKAQEGRKLFIKVSDYVDEEGKAVYAIALHLYRSLGFRVEITHKDFYDEGESQHILGLRLKPEQPKFTKPEEWPVQFNSVYEIAETDDSYSFGWIDDADELFDEDDVHKGIDSVADDEGRMIFLTFPSDYLNIKEPLVAAGFRLSGTLLDYFDDGVHELHFTHKVN
ncbi:MAG: GNAT family N-acetyltransferase [Thiotrichaceae bacterium]|nr:GNAT family N-acetyltransferase [Thiotrichaceae bacterium]